jgi:hypothetical protein
MKEIVDFDVRYAKAVLVPATFGASVEQMQTAIAAQPMLKEGLARMAEESRKMEGTTILTTLTIDAVKSAEQMAAGQQSKKEDSRPGLGGGVGGLLGGLGKRAIQRKAAGDDEPKARATFMTITHERTSIATSASAADVAIPAGFTLAK